MKTTGTFHDDFHERALSPVPPLPSNLDLEPLSRRPIRLSDETMQEVLARPVPIWPGASLNSMATPALTMVSIIVVAHNNLVFTRMCVESVLANTHWPAMELIVVDNGSTDGTLVYLNELAMNVPLVRVIATGKNLGFSAANNLGFQASRGELIVLLNNDTVVSNGWLRCLTAHLHDSTVGATGPVTNRACNEAQVPFSYRTYGEFAEFSTKRMADHAGNFSELPMLSMFCIAMRRQVMEEVGPLDAQFEIGMFEDDDYSMRLRTTGKRLLCAEDCFIHHFGEASFGNLVSDGQFNRLFDANRERFENKWGIQWKPHGRRRESTYDSMIARVREAIDQTVPPGSVTLILNKGDPAFMDVPSRTCRHFPADEQGNYSGHYPADGPSVVAGIQRAKTSGSEFLVIPHSSRWWLDFYPEFRTHLETSAHLAYSDSTSCLIYRLDKVVSKA
jgi:GT2 family glycosyltransferase